MAKPDPHMQLTHSAEPMPPTVVAVIALVAFFIAVDLVDTVLRDQIIGGAISISIAVVIVLGLVRRHALAWQWGVFMPILAALNALAALGYAQGAVQRAMMLALLLANIAIPLLLTRSSARRYFGVRCPRCGSQRTGATDFLYDGHRCKECQVEWRYQ
jgi:hypothetical protein